MARPLGRMPKLRRSIPFALLLLLLGAEPLPPSAALAAEVVRDVVPGAEVDDSIAAGDVHVFRLAVLAGTRLRAELRPRDDEVAKDGESGSGASGPVPELVLLDPDGAELARSPAELRVTVAAAGTYRLEVRAGAYSGGYELRTEGSAPEPDEQSGRRIVTVTGAPVVVHVETPEHGTLVVEVRRRSGAAPQVDGVRDGLGRELLVFVREARPKRVHLEPIPIGVEGGVDVTISAAGGGSGTYELRTRVREAADRPRGGDDREERRIVVQLAPGADAAAVAASLGFELVEVRGNLAVLETPEGREGLEDDDALLSNAAPGVVGAEPEAYADSPEGSQSNAVIVGSEFGRTDVEQQAALAEIHAAVAHATATGAQAVVAVLDTGIDGAHPFFDGRLVAGHDVVGADDLPWEETNGVDDDGDALVDEGFGHGTFVASLVLAAAPDARVLPVRVLDTDGRGTTSDIATGILWAVDHGAHVVNCSFGSLGGSTTIASAVRYALARGVAVVAATGNDASVNIVDFPATLPGVIAVTATQPDGGRADFANAGPATTLAAPGTELVGAYPNGQYATWSGTSFSAALVSGGAALAVQRQPASPPSVVTSRLARTARPVRRTVPRARRRGLGAGVLDLARLVR